MNATPNDFPTDGHGWAELLPRRDPRPAFHGSARVPWAVVGAGVTGLACARRLAELHPGEEILLLEARKVGQGASGRNSGFAVAISHFPGPFDPARADRYRRVNRINDAGLTILRTQVAAHGVDCQWNEGGFHHVAADRQAITEAAHFKGYLEALDIPHETLDRGALADRLGTAHYETGLHVPSGALVQPAALVRGLASALPVGVRLCEESPVLRVDHGNPVTLTLPSGTVQADRILLATNFEAPKLNYLTRRIVGSTLAGSFTRVLTADERAGLGSLTQWGALSLHGGGATVRLTADGRIKLRNTAEFHGGNLLPDAILAQRRRIHRAGFEKRFPHLSHVPFEFSWSGVEGISRNSTNFFGRQAGGIWFAGGYNGSGVTRGTAFGSALAEYASDGQSPLIEDCLASDPAHWIPPRPFLDVAAALKVKARFRGVGKDL